MSATIKGIILADVGVIQGIANFKFFAEQALVKVFPTIIRLEALYNAKTAVSVYPVQLAESGPGAVNKPGRHGTGLRKGIRRQKE